MRKNIDIEDRLLTKLKIISAFENVSVKGLMEQAIIWFVSEKEKQQFDKMSQEEKEDLGLLTLMQQVNRNETASEEEFYDALHQK